MNEEISRAERARQILDDQMFQEAVTAVKAEIYTKFLRTTFDQKDEREELWRKSQAFDALIRYLESVLISGKLAQQNEEQP